MSVGQSNDYGRINEVTTVMKAKSMLWLLFRIASRDGHPE
jgi:hypothetical protein